MAVSSLDGTVIESVVRRQRKQITVFRIVRFALDEGGERTMKNLVAKEDLASHLAAGNRGRFYMHNILDVRGVHGFRGADGTSVLAFPGANEAIFKILVFVNLLWIGLRLFLMGDGIPLLGVGLLIFGIVGWIWSRNTRAEAERQYLEDSAGGPSAPLAKQPV